MRNLHITLKKKHTKTTPPFISFVTLIWHARRDLQITSLHCSYLSFLPIGTFSIKVCSSAQGFGTTSKSSLERTTWQKEQEGPNALVPEEERSTLPEGFLCPTLRSLHSSGKAISVAVTYADYPTSSK